MAIRQKVIFFFCALGALFVLFVPKSFAAQTGGEDIQWAFLTFGLFGGLALFLYGIEMMSDGMKKTAGDGLRSVLAALTRNRVIALLAGAFVTMIVQSSSATTVMLVSFVQAQLMTFAQSLGVILGSDIGTTVTAQLIAFKLTDYAMLMIAVGFLMRMVGPNDKVKNLGEFILGFGILFYGMKVMSDTMKPLRTFPAFIDFLKTLENPFLGLLVGSLFTGLIQSSAAFIGIVIVLAEQSFIPLEAGIPMIFGANIGTCITAGLASIGTTREAKRVALAHVLFKICGVILFLPWIPLFTDVIRELAAQYGSGPARQIANAHTIFNVSIALIFLPFTTLFAKLIMKILPNKPDDIAMQLTVKHLDDAVILSPALAIDLARAEISRMARIVYRMLEAFLTPFLTDKPTQDIYRPKLSTVKGIETRELKVNYLHTKITDYLLRLGGQELSRSQTLELYGMLSIVKELETIGDILLRNMIPLIGKKRSSKFDFSDEGKAELERYHKKMILQIRRLEDAFTEKNTQRARKIMDREGKYLEMESLYRERHLERVCQSREESVQTHEIHMELMGLMTEIIIHTTSIAKTFFEHVEQIDE